MQLQDGLATARTSGRREACAGRDARAEPTAARRVAEHLIARRPPGFAHEAVSSGEQPDPSPGASAIMRRRHPATGCWPIHAHPMSSVVVS